MGVYQNDTHIEPLVEDGRYLRQHLHHEMLERLGKGIIIISRPSLFCFWNKFLVDMMNVSQFYLEKVPLYIDYQPSWHITLFQRTYNIKWTL